MTTPRFLIKTHAQVRNPRIFSLLVAACTYPDRAYSPGRVAACLSESMGSTGHSFKAASNFAVLMAKDFGFLNSNMSWGSNGYVLHAVLANRGKSPKRPERLLELPYSPHERVGFLRYYLEADGAILWALVKRISEVGGSPIYELGSGLASLFADLYREYLDMMRPGRQRELARSRASKLSRDGYSRGTIPHKLWPHVQPLIDLGVLALDEDQILIPTRESEGCLVRNLAEQFHSLYALEKTFSEFRFFEVIARQIGRTNTQFNEQLHRDRLDESLAAGYALMKNEMTGLAHLNALCDWACIDLLVTSSVVVERNDVREYLRRVYRSGARKIRFEVDFRGQPAYVVFQ